MIYRESHLRLHLRLGRLCGMKEKDARSKGLKLRKDQSGRGR